MAKQNGLWIDGKFLAIEGIDIMAAAILAIIASYEKSRGLCYATNSQLSDRINASVKPIKERIRSLEKCGIIRIENPGTPNRTLFILDVKKRYQKDQLKAVKKPIELVPFVKEEVPEGPLMVPEGPLTGTRRTPINKDNKNNKEVINLSAAHLPKTASLHKAIEAAFLSKCGAFTDYPREGRAIKGLITKAEARGGGDPWAFINQVITKFYEIRKTDKFFGKQPFTPSALNTLGIFDRVMVNFETAKNEIPEELRYLYEGVELNEG